VKTQKKGDKGWQSGLKTESEMEEEPEVRIR